MAKLSEKVHAEYEQIENLLNEMPATEKLPYLSLKIDKLHLHLLMKHKKNLKQ